jgi:hypothetical protein
VTTVLDAAIRPEVLAELRGWLAAGEPGPSFLALGPPIPARDGYMSSGYPEMIPANAEDVDPKLAVVEANGAFGVKVPIERGFGKSGVARAPPEWMDYWEPSRSILDRLLRRAERRG